MSHCPPQQIRQLRRDNPKLRDRDFASQFHISEAELVAAHVGRGVTRLEERLENIFPRLQELGEVMALTRNESCVIEKVGTYADFRPGKHAAMVLTPEIDLRLFPRHYAFAFAVERTAETGTRRSLQFFDAAGDAIHKIHLRDTSNLAAWRAIVADLALPDQNDCISVSPRQLGEPPKADPEKAPELREAWSRMTDTHQFRQLVSKLKMNRLGAYRIVGKPQARALMPEAINQMLHAIRDTGIDVMIFVGNPGCIQIHSGPIQNLRSMGPWQNILDDGFDLHLRLDHIAEVWAVSKPTQRGAAISVEAFDAQGQIILQIFGRRTQDRDFRPQWASLVETLPNRGSANADANRTSNQEAAE